MVFVEQSFEESRMVFKHTIRVFISNKSLFFNKYLLLEYVQKLLHLMELKEFSKLEFLQMFYVIIYYHMRL